MREIISPADFIDPSFFLTLLLEGIKLRYRKRLAETDPGGKYKP
jgi:hypothetical protein